MSPVIHIVKHLTAGRRTQAQLVELTGNNPTTIRKHIHALYKAGLIVPDGWVRKHPDAMGAAAVIWAWRP